MEPKNVKIYAVRVKKSPCSNANVHKNIYNIRKMRVEKYHNTCNIVAKKFTNVRRI